MTNGDTGVQWLRTAVYDCASALLTSHVHCHGCRANIGGRICALEETSLSCSFLRSEGAFARHLEAERTTKAELTFSPRSAAASAARRRPERKGCAASSQRCRGPHKRFSGIHRGGNLFPR